MRVVITDIDIPLTALSFILLKVVVALAIAYFTAYLFLMGGMMALQSLGALVAALPADFWYVFFATLFGVAVYRILRRKRSRSAAARVASS